MHEVELQTASVITANLDTSVIESLHKRSGGLSIPHHKILKKTFPLNVQFLHHSRISILTQKKTQLIVKVHHNSCCCRVCPIQSSGPFRLSKYFTLEQQYCPPCLTRFNLICLKNVIVFLSFATLEFTWNRERKCFQE